VAHWTEVVMEETEIQCSTFLMALPIVHSAPCQLSLLLCSFPVLYLFQVLTCWLFWVPPVFHS